MKYLKLLYKINLFIILSIIIIIIGLYAYAYFAKPVQINPINTYELYDNNDNIFYEGTKNNKWIKISDINDNLKNAVISVEDKNFYNHNGFDYLRIFKAIIKNIKSRKIIEGGSTISQQYIKNAYLNFDKTWNRKIEEALLTLNLEVHYTKDQILEAYLNTINYGMGNYGISSAARYYFNKEAKDLSLEESLVLAGIPKNPSNYNPFTNYDKSIKRAKVVAISMLNNKYITPEEYNNLFKNKLYIYGEKNNSLKSLPYYEDVVINELKNIKGISNIHNLKIYTSLDLNVQNEMENSINNNLSGTKLQIASVIINPNNAEIIALTGGTDYNISQFNRALYSKRQVGSTMKPFLYYAALNNGLVSSSTFLSQYTTFNLDNGKTYSPKNYANIYANKEITMAAAIAYSDNIYAVKTNLFLGVDKLINTAKLCGISEKLDDVASLALGTTELNILDFANGYTTLASGGYKRKIHTIKRIENQNGKIIYEHRDDSDLVLNPNYVFILNELLTSTTNTVFKDYNTPTAINIAGKLNQKYAIKTGTTDTDYWSVGYNKNILMVTWSGYDNNNEIELSLGNKIKNIFAQTISKIPIKEDDSWYKMPKNVIGLPLDAISGMPTNDINKTNIFYYLKGSEPIINH